MKKKNYKEVLNSIKAFIFDIDGVLTNGKILITSKGDMYREMDTKDGFAIKYALNKGFKIAIISGGKDKGLKIRLQDLGIKNIFLGFTDKERPFNDFIKNEDIKPNDILYMGDDIPDIKIMKKVLLATCPNDAVIDVKEISDYVSPKNGGQGCVREIIEQVLRVQNKWI
ncbi:MAG: 3-deoxy-D-manno-octulosonate 8-phosphate phosphatase [Flavobacteriaceae bacterium TMED220]|nr:MAG: 3-deoxy-D-manno-octulosonate 8-phosphate phosphatase [Flavobacteriaceae bacterium TMED220]|tara:strand:+ start:788 stop:1294 length:507 start_codon:yes stop_codon:yes gene_type:complete